MKKKVLAIAAGLATLGSATFADEYVVQPGDSLSKIANKYNDLSVDDLIDLNSGEFPHLRDNPNRISVGMVLDIGDRSIEDKVTTSELINFQRAPRIYSDNPNLPYIVQSGDTVSGIAKELGVTVEDIYKNTPFFKEGDTLKIGQVVRGAPFTFSTEKGSGIVVIDPGHGPDNATRGVFDAGTETKGFEEAQATYDLAVELAHFLSERGYTPILTRDHNDRNGASGMHRTDRPKLADKYNAKAYIAIHFDAVEEMNPDIRGFSMLHESTGRDNINLAASALDAYRTVFYQFDPSGKDNGLKVNDELIVLSTKSPAFILEGGFPLNPLDRAVLTHPAFNRESAEYIAEGVHQFLLYLK